MGAEQVKEAVVKTVTKRKFSAKQIYDAMLSYRSTVDLAEFYMKDLQSVYSGLVAQSGIDSTMPKAQGGISNVVHAEYVRREKIINSHSKAMDRVQLIQQFTASEAFHDLRSSDQSLLNYMLAGEKLNVIAKKMQLPSRTAYDRAERIAKSIERFQYC